MYVRRDAGETLKKLIAIQRYVTLLSKLARKKCVPDSMHVQNGMRLCALTIDNCVQAGFSRRLALTRNLSPFKINFDKAPGLKRAFIAAARRDENTVSIAHAEVAACGGDPATRGTPSRRGADSFHLRSRC